jgi:hypothetical protein
VRSVTVGCLGSTTRTVRRVQRAGSRLLRAARSLIETLGDRKAPIAVFTSRAIAVLMSASLASTAT